MYKEYFKEVEKFIKKCRKLKLSDDFVLKLIEMSPKPKSVESSSPLSQTVKKPRKADLEKMEQQASLQSQFEEIRDEISTAHVEDPLAYEDAIVRGILGNEENHEGRRT